MVLSTNVLHFDWKINNVLHISANPIESVAISPVSHGPLSEGFIVPNGIHTARPVSAYGKSAINSPLFHDALITSTHSMILSFTVSSGPIMRLCADPVSLENPIGRMR